MRWALVLACMAGCTQTFGLDSARDDDRDGDQVPDGTDNCPDVPNHDQSRHDLSDPRGDACRVCMATDPTDSDGDGIPDQCDGCDNRLPDANHNGVPDACENPHDEDGDGVPDLVDNCPSVANADQADTMEGQAAGGPARMPDGVGDACDDTIFEDGQIFDSFAQRNQLWLVLTGHWQDGNDHTIVELSPLFPTRLAGLGINTFTVSTSLTVNGSGIAGVVAIDSAGDHMHVVCGIAALGGHTYLSMSASNDAGALPAPKAIEITPRTAGIVKLEIAPSSAIAQVAGCSIDGAGSIVMGLPTANTVWHPGLQTTNDLTSSGSTGTAQFDYYDVVTSVP